MKAQGRLYKAGWISFVQTRRLEAENSKAQASPQPSRPTKPPPTQIPSFLILPPKAATSFPFSLSAKLTGALASPSPFPLPPPEPDPEPTCSLPAPPRPVW